MERACDLCHITLNKNAVVGDVSAMAPGGVRIGAPAMTSRGLKEADFEAIADMLHDVLTICKDVQASSGRLLKDFNRGLDGAPIGRAQPRAHGRARRRDGTRAAMRAQLASNRGAHSRCAGKWVAT